jgi:hypothetical protein
MVSALLKLKSEGVVEVSLGPCPLQVFDPSVPSFANAEFPWPLRPWVWLHGRSYRLMARYKRKFAPTNWENVYLAADGAPSAVDFYGLFRIFYPEGVLGVVRWQGRRRASALLPTAEAPAPTSGRRL